MAKVVIIGPNLPTQDGVHHVHAEGCEDIVRSPIYKSREYNDDKKRVYEVGSLKELTHEVYAPNEFDYDGETEWRDFEMDIKVFPCVRDLPDE